MNTDNMDQVNLRENSGNYGLNVKELKDIFHNSTVPGPPVPGPFKPTCVFLLLFNLAEPHILAIQKTDSEGYPWRNQVALDIFVVKPPPDPLFEDERWAKAAGHLDRALSGKLDLTAALEEKFGSMKQETAIVGSRPPRVVIDNDTSSFFTIIEVFTHDFLGL